jgi:seryl-tRNA synthetase
VPERTLLPGEIEGALDRRFARARRGATPIDPAPVLSGGFLERVAFFENFPRRAVAAGPGAFLPPATCYRLFQELAGRRLSEPFLATLTGTCFRRERREQPGRRRAFTMREIVVVDGEDAVREARDATAAASLRLARRLGLEARLQEAEDPFFVGPGEGRRLLQRLLRLKFELVAPVDGEPLPLASFNVHQDFFGERLSITLRGRSAWSGCAAWGIERWRLALEERWGRTARRWPVEVRRAIGLA